MSSPNTISQDEQLRVLTARGRAYGERLQPYGQALARIASDVRSSHAEALNTLNGEIQKLDTTIAAESPVVKGYGDYSERLSEKHLELLTKRAEDEGRFSLLKGLLFLFIALVMLAGDIGLLASALATMLGTTFSVPTAGGGTITFTELLFQNPWAAIRSFPGLFGLVVSVICMGLFVKVLDEYAFSEESGIDEEKARKWKRWLYLAALVVSFGVVLVISASRAFHEATAQVAGQLQTPSGVEGTLAGIASALLGIALPYVGALFFIRGTDKLGRFYRIWRVTLKKAPYKFWAFRRNRTAEQNARAKAALESERDKLSNTTHLTDQISALQEAFMEGYREGAVSTINVFQHSERTDPIGKLRARFFRLALMQRLKTQNPPVRP